MLWNKRSMSMTLLISWKVYLILRSKIYIPTTLLFEGRLAMLKFNDFLQGVIPSQAYHLTHNPNDPPTPTAARHAHEVYDMCYLQAPPGR